MGRRFVLTDEMVMGAHEAPPSSAPIVALVQVDLRQAPGSPIYSTQAVVLTSDGLCRPVEYDTPPTRYRNEVAVSPDGQRLAWPAAAPPPQPWPVHSFPRERHPSTPLMFGYYPEFGKHIERCPLPQYRARSLGVRGRLVSDAASSPIGEAPEHPELFARRISLDCNGGTAYAEALALVRDFADPAPPDAVVILSGSDQGNHRLVPVDRLPSYLQVSPDGRLIAMVHPTKPQERGPRIRVWTRAGEPVAELEQYTTLAKHMAWSQDSSRLLYHQRVRVPGSSLLDRWRIFDVTSGHTTELDDFDGVDTGRDRQQQMPTGLASDDGIFVERYSDTRLDVGLWRPGRRTTWLLGISDELGAPAEAILPTRVLLDWA